jgi:hypothetical protein
MSLLRTILFCDFWCAQIQERALPESPPLVKPVGRGAFFTPPNIFFEKLIALMCIRTGKT